MTESAHQRPRRIYLDNAATSHPKPPEVAAAMFRYMTEIGGNPGRGAYAESLDALSIVSSCRRAIAELLHAPSPDSIVFTQNCTEALNLAIQGLVDPASTNHLICTSMEHNSVLRPMHELQRRGLAEVSVVEADPKMGEIEPADIERAIRPDTRLIVISHASNVTGAIQPVEDVIRRARCKGVTVLIDAAQTAGHLPIDISAMEIDLLAASGHKGLLGPTGTGFLYVRTGLEDRIRTLKQGGTGTDSDEILQPSRMPERFECGTLNVAGIAGLAASVDWILRRGVESIREAEIETMRTFLEQAMAIPKLKLFGPRDPAARVGVFSVRLGDWLPQELSSVLEVNFGIVTRSGLHCAPLAHRTLGTNDGGTTRFSFGALSTQDDANHAIEALHTSAA